MKKVFLLFILSLVYHFSLAQVSRNFYEISRERNEYYKRAGKNAPGYKEFKRWEWYYSTRMGPDGNLVDNQRLNQQALRNSSVNRNAEPGFANANSGSWTSLGPTFVNSENKGIGRVNRLAFHPTNPDIIYAASATGGLWISPDGGLNWYSYSEGIPNMSLSGVVVDYTNPNIIYILTGDADAVSSGARRQFEYGKVSNGILKSFDGGFTWTETSLKWTVQMNMVGYKLVMHPTNHNILMLATNGGLFRTTDGGNTWDSTNNNANYYDIEFQPGNPSVVYTSGTYADSIVFYKSVNSGATFTKTHGIKKVDNADNKSSVNRSAIGVSAASPNTVYLLTGPCTAVGQFHGVYRSTDAGESFTLRASTPNILGGSSLGADANDQENYDLAIAVNPTNSSQLVTGGIRIWTSANGGSNFTFQDDNVSTVSYYHPDIHDLIYHPLDNSILYMACDGGVYRSNDNGDNWYNLNTGLQVSQYYKISINTASGAGNENVIIGGLQDNGTNKRTIAGGTSFTKISGSDGMDCVIDPDNINTYITSAQDGVFYYSGNAGSSFETICTPETLSATLNSTVDGFWVTPVAEVTGTNSTFVMGYKPVILAIRLAPGSYAFAPLGWSGRTFVKTARGNASRIYVGDNDYQNNNQVHTTTNQGGTWNDVYSSPRSGRSVTDLAFDPSNGNRMWLTFGGYNSTLKVLYSGNGGDNGGTWNDITGSLPPIPINCIVYDDGGGNDAIYIGTDIGVFYRDNTLGDWVPFSNGLPVVEITDLEIHPVTRMLRAGTYGRGIWETSLYSGCPLNYTLNTGNTNIFQPYYFQASQTISSTAQHLSAGGNAFYKAGQEIVLSPGFWGTGNGGNVFEAAIGPCGGGVPSRTQYLPVKSLRGFMRE